MAFSKSQHYPVLPQRVSFYARALSHPARITIIEQLLSEGPLTVDLIAKIHPLSQPALSVHLKILRKAHLIAFKEQFPYTIYRVDKKNLALAREYITAFLKKI